MTGFIPSSQSFYGTFPVVTDRLAEDVSHDSFRKDGYSDSDCLKVKVSLSVVPSLCDPMDCSLQGSSVRGISQATVLEWVAIPFSRGSSQPRDGTQISCIAGGFFPAGPPGKPLT